MPDITSPRLIYFKALLFIVCGGMAAGLLWMESPTLKAAALLALTVWCFSRAYYCAFYVIEHYVDRQYRFAGLWSFVRYLAARRGSARP
jgi:hypothetical protein